jgi:hypothetical protein
VDPTSLVGRRSRGGYRAFVALAPGQDGPDNGRKLAALLGVDPFRARQLLRRQVHVVFAFDDPAARSQLAERLRDIGLRSESYDQRELDAVADAVPVARAIVQQGSSEIGHPYRQGGAAAIEIANPSGGGATLRASEIQLIVTGTIRVSQRRVRAPSGNRSIDAVVSWSNRGRTVDRKLDAHRVVDLYGAFPAPVRFVERMTRIDGLAALPYEKASGFAQLLAWLEQVAPRAPVDDGFALFSRHTASAASTRLAADLGAAEVLDETLTPGFAEWSARAWLLWKRGA